jgi:hypothetical protein
MKSKRGAELSLNVIIIAVLCIVVMVVLLYIFGGKIGLFKSSTTCGAREGTCMQSLGSICSSEKPIMIWTEDCECVGDKGTGKTCNTNGKPGQCCINVG